MRAKSKNAPVLNEVITYIAESEIMDYEDLAAYAAEHDLTDWQKVMAQKKYEYLFRIYLYGHADYLNNLRHFDSQ